jgi:hypothetical protein
MAFQLDGFQTNAFQPKFTYISWAGLTVPLGIDDWPRIRTSTYSKSNSLSTTVNKPVGTVSGDLLVAFVFGAETDPGNGITRSTPSGWTEITYYQSTYGGSADTLLAAYYKVAGGSEPTTYTFSITGPSTALVQAHVLRITGHDTSSPIGDSSATGLSANSTVEWEALTLEGSDSLVLAAGVAVDSVSSVAFSLDAPPSHALVAEKIDGSIGSYYSDFLVAARNYASSGAISAQTDTLSSAALWKSIHLEVKKASGGVSGTLSVTQAANTLSADADAPIAGSLSVSQAANTLASDVDNAVQGSLGASQAANTLTSDVDNAVKGTLSVSQAANTLAADADAFVIGSLSASQAANSLTADADAPIVGSLSASQAADTLSATGEVVSTGAIATLNVSQAADTLSADADAVATGSLSVSQAANTLTADADAIATGSLTASQAANTLTSEVDNAVKGSLNGAAGDPLWGYVDAVAHFDGANGATTTTISIGSGKSNSITMYNGAVLSDAQPRFGPTALALTPLYGGAKIYLQTAITSVPFTIETSFYPTSFSQEFPVVDSRTGTNDTWGFRFYVNTSGKLAVWFYNGGAYSATGTTTVTTNTYHSAAICRDSSGRLYGFLDGNLEFSIACSNTFYRQEYFFGSSYVSLSGLGYIDEARITREVARYTSSYTALPAAFPTFGPRSEQDSQTLVADADAPIVGSLSASQAADTLSATGEVVPTGAIATLNVSQAADTLSADADAVATGSLSVSQAANTLTADADAFIAASLSVSQAADTLSADTSSSVAASLNTSQAANTLGATAGNLVTCNLTTVEGDDPYFANVVSLLHFDGADESSTFIDVKGKTWTKYNNAQLESDQKKFGPTSAYFYGGADYIESPASADWAFGSGAFTIEMWVYGRGLNGSVIFDNYAYPNGANPASNRLQFTGIALEWRHNDTTSPLTTASIPSGQWNHIALVRTPAGVLKIFINGVADAATTTTTANIGVSSITMRIGAVRPAFSGAALSTYVDDFRITKGVCRYYSNFSVPTAAFSNGTGSALSATGVVAVAGALAVSQAANTLTADTSASIAASLSAAQAADTLAADADTSATASLSVSQAADTLAADADTFVAASLSVSQAADTLAADADTFIVASFSALQAADTLSASGSVASTAIIATLDAVQAANALSADADVVIAASLSASQAGHTLVSDVDIAVAGAFSASQAGDTLASDVDTAVTGALSASQASHTLVSDVDTAVTGALSASQAADTLVATAGSPVITGTLAASQAAQTLASSGVVAVAASLAAAQEAQGITSAAAALVQSALVTAQQSDGVVAVGMNEVLAALAAQQDDDTLSASAQVLNPGFGTLDVTQVSDTLVASGFVATSAGDELLCFSILNVSRQYSITSYSAAYATLDLSSAYTTVDYSVDFSVEDVNTTFALEDFSAVRSITDKSTVFSASRAKLCS